MFDLVSEEWIAERVVELQALTALVDLSGPRAGAADGGSASSVLDPVTREETAVGGNLLEVSATNPEVHVGTWATAERWRRSTGPSATSRR